MGGCTWLFPYRKLLAQGDHLETVTHRETKDKSAGGRSWGDKGQTRPAHKDAQLVKITAYETPGSPHPYSICMRTRILKRRGDPGRFAPRINVDPACRRKTGPTLVDH